jgi:pilus assembly protein CpaB
MRGRVIVPMVVGLGIGLLALRGFVNVLQKAKGAPSSTVPVVYAMSNIEPTLEIQDSMVEVRHVAKEAAPDTGFQDKAEVVGRVASWPIPKGCPIGAMQLAAKGTPPGMAVRIADGARAVAVQIDESAGVAGWLKPGSRVDVVVMLDNPQRAVSQSISKVILQNVEVLAVGQSGKASDTAAELARSVTLAVKPAEVPKLHLAASKGKLRLAMRNPHDGSLAKGESTTDNDLFSLNSGTDPSAKSPSSPLPEGFSNAQPKVRVEQADKELQPVKSEVPASQPVSTVVEVIRGLDAVEQVQFEQRTQGWHRVEGQAGQHKPSAAASPAKPRSPLPNLLPAKAAPTPAVSAVDPNKPQA